MRPRQPNIPTLGDLGSIRQLINVPARERVLLRRDRDNKSVSYRLQVLQEFDRLLSNPAARGGKAKRKRAVQPTKEFSLQFPLHRSPGQGTGKEKRAVRDTARRDEDPMQTICWQFAHWERLPAHPTLRGARRPPSVAVAGVLGGSGRRAGLPAFPGGREGVQEAAHRGSGQARGRWRTGPPKTPMERSQ